MGQERPAQNSPWKDDGPSSGPGYFHQVSKMVTGTVRLCRVPEVFLFDQLGGGHGDIAALEVVVDRVVAQAQFVLVGAAGLAVEEVGRGDLLPDAGRGAQFSEQGTVLALVQSEQRQDIRAAVAVLVKKPVTDSAPWSVPMTR